MKSINDILLEQVFTTKDTFKLEQASMAKADEFYKKMIPGCEIERQDYRTPQGKINQLKDIDVILRLGNKEWSVSEKFYSKDFGECIIELCTGTDKTWVEASEADILASFQNTNLYTTGSIKQLQFIRTLVMQQCQQFIDDMRDHNITTRRIPAIINYKGRVYSWHLLATDSKSSSGSSWTAVSVTAPWRDLMNFGVRYKLYPNYENYNK